VKIDAHQHFWRYNARAYPWIPHGSALQRDWMPEDLASCLAAAGLEGSVAVQARQSLEESRWLLELTEQSPIIKGVVGWVDLRSETVEGDLAELAGHPRFRGVRHVVQDEPDDGFLVQPAFMRGISKLQEFGLTYDLLIFPRQLPAAIELVHRFPQQPFVVDHLAKPPIKRGALSPWREQIRELARPPNVMCKLSGMVTEADHKQWDRRDLRPYLEVVIEAFGEDRLMYGSDWPVCLLAASYAAQHEAVAAELARFGAGLPDKVFGGNASRFYGMA
jgi:L-fuconolactonase